MSAPEGNNYASQFKTEKEIDRFVEELLSWAHDSRSIHLSKFCRLKKHSRQWLYEVAQHYPKIKDAIEEAKDLLAAKIVDSCFYDKDSGCNASFGEKYLPLYDVEYKALLKWKAEIQKEIAQKEENLSAIKQYIKHLNETKQEDKPCESA